MKPDLRDVLENVLWFGRIFFQNPFSKSSEQTDIKIATLYR